MLTRRRVAGALLAMVLPAVTALTGVTSATAAPTPATPPGCATNDPNPDCLHAPSPDLAPVVAPTYTTSYDLKTQTRTVDLNVAVTPPYHACPLTPGIPYAYLPCTQPNVIVNLRVYAPGNDTPLGFTAAPVDGSACVFTCDAQFKITGQYHGPATFIVKYSLGEVLATQGNDLFTSTAETTIVLPSDPFVGALHATAAKVILNGKLKSQTLQLAGKGGIPKSGVGGVLAIIRNTGTATVQGGDYLYGGLGTLEVIPGTTLHIKKQDPGTLTVTTVGWWSKTPTDSGNMMHVTAKSRHLPLKGTVSLTHYLVPADATGALINVITPKGASRVGGVLVAKSAYEQFVLVPLKAGATLAIKAAKGSTIIVRGYLAPVRAVESGFTLTTITTPTNLPGALQVG
jgi:hypothetical protein